jgi:hypothetical protein
MKRHDTITMHEAILAAKRTRPTLTVRQIAAIFGVCKSQVGSRAQGGLVPLLLEVREEIRG